MQALGSRSGSKRCTGSSCISQQKLEYFVLYIFPWIIYEFISLALFIPALVFGAMSCGDKCVELTGIVSAPVWLFVYMGAVLLLNGAFSPIIYMFIKMNVKTKVTKKYVVSFVVSMICIAFLMAWSGVGIQLYGDLAQCSNDLIARSVLSLSIVWFALIVLIIFALIIASVVLILTA